MVSYNIRCYLITFYFKRKILIELHSFDNCEGNVFSTAENAATKFIDKFGAYINLHEALVAASNCHSQMIIQKLLELATHDPSHIDNMKLFSRSGMCVPYEQKYLSCLLTLLPCNMKKKKERDNLFGGLIASYPDIKPWQIRCIINSSTTEFHDPFNEDTLIVVDEDDIIYYYKYLSLLMENSQMARLDQTLVNEWCVLSCTKQISWDKMKRRQNFLQVALNQSELKFAQDIPFLLQTSVKSGEHDVTLKVTSDIILDDKLRSDNVIIATVINALHVLSKESLNSCDDNESNQFDSKLMQKILLTWKNVSSVHELRGTISVCDELGHLLDNCKHHLKKSTEQEESLILLMAKIMPSVDTLSTLSSRATERFSSSKIVSALKICLEKGDYDNSDEISNALLYLRKVRPNIQTSRAQSSAPGIWKKWLVEKL